jgi:hypothetical protein
MLIQDIFKQYGQAYLDMYGNNMPHIHIKTLKAVMSCRTKSLGGEVYFCSKCREYHYSYHSCQNRHCVVCQSGDAAEWIEKQKNNLLPFTYFLATFTMPRELRNLCRKKQKLFYSILFKASSDALKLLAKDEKYLGADIGMIGILHTWTRALIYHAHVHYLIPGGGIGNDGKTIRFSDHDFLMHVKPLSIIFKAKFRDLLKQRAPEIFKMIPTNTWKRDWVVHIKAVGNGDKALEYMGRYLFRVAISNNRILKLGNGSVTFRYTDSKTGITKIVTIEAFEFIRRFLQHVLPHKFMKVRYYGFLAAASKKKLHKIRKMLFMDSIPVKNTPDGLKADKILVCPVCGNPLQWIEKIPKGLPRAESKGFIDYAP